MVGYWVRESKNHGPKSKSVYIRAIPGHKRRVMLKERNGPTGRRPRGMMLRAIRDHLGLGHKAMNLNGHTVY